VVSALGEIIDDGVIHPEEKVKVKVRHKRGTLFNRWSR